MSIKYIFRDRSFKKFIVGLVILVGLTGISIFLFKNYLPSLNERQIAKTDEPIDLNEDKSNQPNQTNDNEKLSENEVVGVSDDPTSTSTSESVSINSLSDSQTLPRTGPTNTIVMLIVLFAVSYFAVSFIQAKLSI